MGRARGSQAAAAVADLNAGARFDHVVGARRSTRPPSSDEQLAADTERNLDRLEKHLVIRGELGDLPRGTRYLLGIHQSPGDDLHQDGYVMVVAPYEDLDDLKDYVALWWSEGASRAGQDPGTPEPSFVVDLSGDGDISMLDGSRSSLGADVTLTSMNVDFDEATEAALIDKLEP